MIKSEIINYLKILFITLGIQLLSIGIAYLFYFLPDEIKAYKLIPIVIGGSYVLSIGLDILFSIRWLKTLPGKLISIFLMPTNYTIFLWLGFGIYLLLNFLETMRAWNEKLKLN